MSNLWNDIVKETYGKLCEQGVIDPEREPSYLEHPATGRSVLQHMEEAEAHHSEGEPAETVHDEVKTHELIIEFAEETKHHITSLIPTTFKLLWDGTLSPMPPASAENSAYAQLTNKHFVETLLDVRVSSQNDDEPPVTLLHGSETETVVKSSLLRVKLE